MRPGGNEFHGVGLSHGQPLDSLPLIVFRFEPGSDVEIREPHVPVSHVVERQQQQQSRRWSSEIQKTKCGGKVISGLPIHH